MSYQPKRLTPPPPATPEIYSQDGKGYEATAHAHYFGPGLIDIYVTEYDPATGEMFGWAEITPGGGELGYSSLVELDDNPSIEHDDYWTPCTLRQAIEHRAEAVGTTTNLPTNND